MLGRYATCIILGSSKSTILQEAGQLYALVLGRLDKQNAGSFSWTKCSPRQRPRRDDQHIG